MSEELKPCPWCGYAARYIIGYGVQCTGCGASRPSTADEAIAAWNTRPPIVVTDEMLNRACAAVYVLVTPSMRADMLAALTAALTPKTVDPAA